jgi:hypothetical protein
VDGFPARAIIAIVATPAPGNEPHRGMLEILFVSPITIAIVFVATILVLMIVVKILVGKALHDKDRQQQVIESSDGGSTKDP